MKTILVPTDFSENARMALSYAAVIAKATHAQLVVLHAYHMIPTDPMLPQGMYDTISETLDQQAQVSLQTYEEDVAPLLSVPCRFETKPGLVSDVILREAKHADADLIVMGTRGAGGILGNVIGSITTAVIQAHQFPVLAIPMGKDPGDLKTIVFGTDYHELKNPGTLQPLMDMARAFESKIHILNANLVLEKLGFDYTGEEQLEHLLQEYEVCFDYTDEEDVEKALYDCVKQEKASVLAMIAHKRGFWKSLFHHSLTRSASLHTPVPLLILPDLE